MTLSFFFDKLYIVMDMDGILIIDKDKDMTSRDVVNIVGKKLNTKHVGHTGTLDPLATGVLVLGVNDGCKIIELLTGSTKTYEAQILVGTSTDTYDITGKILEKVDIDMVDYNLVKKVIDNFPRVYEQEVPIYSAVHVNGKRLYEYARSDISVELPKRKVEIYDLELLDISNNIIKIKATVSKGTYIRSLINDIGRRLNIPCCMKNLRRIKQGIFDITMAYKIDEIDSNTKLISIKDALNNMETIMVDDITKTKVSNGMILSFDTYSDMVLVVDHNDKLLAIYKRYEKDKTKMKPYKVFKEEK